MNECKELEKGSFSAEDSFKDEVVSDDDDELADSEDDEGGLIEHSDEELEEEEEEEEGSYELDMSDVKDTLSLAGDV
jgi:hypothetical protein